MPDDQYYDGSALTDEEVLDFVTEFAGAQAAGKLPLRIAPQDGQDPGDKVFRLPVQCPDGTYLAVAFKFGQDNPEDAMTAWKPRWQHLDGPMTLEELQELGRD
jgi:hypothetical protein